jgi:hypothetical protein
MPCLGHVGNCRRLIVDRRADSGGEAEARGAAAWSTKRLAHQYVVAERATQLRVALHAAHEQP